ncbi:MAG: c-type cytochrome [Pelovirga sp.]
MKKVFCLFAVVLLLTACSDDSTDTAAQPDTSESTAAEGTVQKATDAVQKTADQVVEKGAELKEETQEVVQKASDAVAEKTDEVQTGAQQLVKDGSDKLAALTPSAATFDQGSSVYEQNCRSCHDSGIMGAPEIGADRYSADIEELVTNSINGIGRMPARGGNSSLSDEDVRAAVMYMVEESK